MPAFPFLEEPLRGDRVLVRDYAERDIPEILIAYQDDPQLHARMGERRPPSGAELGRRAEQEPAERATGHGATLTIVQGDDEICRGQVYVHHVEWEHRRADVGIWVAPQARGSGAGATALGLVTRWLLRTCGLERVQVVTEADNQPMITTAQAAGFVHEGVLRAYTRGNGTRVDHAVLSLLPSDLAR